MVGKKKTDFDRAVIIDENFQHFVNQHKFPDPVSRLSVDKAGLAKEDMLDLFQSQLLSRHLDLLARELKQKNQVFYTIASSGHEGNAAIARVFRSTDIAFLHYRSGAFMLERARKEPTIDTVSDVILSLMAAADDPISGGRHKVFGSVPLWVPPQTSTIASHLAKSVGTAASIKRGQLLDLETPLLRDAVVLCSFGDASLNHASALSAVNAAQWMAHQHYPLPLVFICEDNGLGISVPTPHDWIEAKIKAQPEMAYIQASGLHLPDIYMAAKKAEHLARVKRKPVFLHMRCVRLMGHAGADYEPHYRTRKQIADTEFQDPLLHTARLLIEADYLSPAKVVAQYKLARREVHDKAFKLLGKPALNSAAAVKSSVIPPARHIEPPTLPSKVHRHEVFGAQWDKLQKPLNLNQQLNAAMTDLLLQYENLLVFGEDVGKKGGVYRVTADLQQRFGQARVFDTLLDETSILGYAIGHAHNGFLPMPEIQFLAYLHNAEDQLRGEAATLSFFSQGQFTNPMVLRIASFGYQKGFGGHFHNDNSIAVLRDLPGVIVAAPSSGLDAAKMLRHCVELAYVQQRIIVFLEPIALYMTKDLHAEGDNLWCAPYPDIEEQIKLGELGISGEGNDLAIISYANGHYLSQQAAKVLREQHNIKVKVIDLRWLEPLNESALCSEVQNSQHILIVDEGRRTGSISEQILTCLQEGLPKLPPIRRLTGEDCFISLGTSWQYLLPSKDDIIAAARDLMTQ